MSHLVVSRKTYFVVFAALIALLALTVAVAQVDAGAWNVVVALAVAVTKAVLILLFFMQVKDASPLQRCFVVSGFLFLAILFTITFADYLSRGPWDVTGQAPPVQAGPAEPE